MQTREGDKRAIHDREEDSRVAITLWVSLKPTDFRLRLIEEFHLPSQNLCQQLLSRGCSHWTLLLLQHIRRSSYAYRYSSSDIFLSLC